MDKYECGSIRLWNICSEILLEYVVLSVYYWDHLHIIALLVWIDL